MEGNASLTARGKSLRLFKGRVSAVPRSVVDELMEVELCLTIGESRLLLGACAEGATVIRVGLSSGGMWPVIFSLGMSFLVKSSIRSW